MSINSLGGIYGLSGSGLDIDSIVKKLMISQQAKEDSLFQKKTLLQWKKDAYNKNYDDLNDFRNNIFNYKLQSNLSHNKVSSNNTDVANATANVEAADISHTLVVAQLAGGVNLTSDSAISLTNPPKLGTLATQLGTPTTPPTFNLKITNGSKSSQSISINPQTDTINDVISKINGAGVDVHASYDSTLDRFFLSTTNMGSSSGISFDGSDQEGLSFLYNQLNLTSAVSNNSGTYSSNLNIGLDAAFQLDGVNLTEASNTFTISGVTYNLTGKTKDGSLVFNNDTKTFSGTAGTATNISITNDIDTTVSSIQSLVDSYNTILTEINSMLDEARYADYLPLTDAQKAEMKDSDITLWDEKAKSGMLHHDSTLTNLVYNLRNAISNPVTGITSTNVSGTPITYNSAASIGITTGAYTEGGKLYLNTNKLRTALQANPNVLIELFSASGTTTGSNTVNPQSQGIAGRLYDTLKGTMDQLKQIAGTTSNAQYDSTSNIAKSIASYNKQINKAKDDYNRMESAYYKQFNALEVAMQQLNNQSSWLSSQLGNIGG